MVQYLPQIIPGSSEYINRFVEEYQTYSLKAVIVPKCNKIIVAIIHGATVLQKYDVL
jgi:hypothetical protein